MERFLDCSPLDSLVLIITARRRRLRPLMPVSRAIKWWLGGGCSHCWWNNFRPGHPGSLSERSPDHHRVVFLFGRVFFCSSSSWQKRRVLCRGRSDYLVKSSWDFFQVLLNLGLVAGNIFVLKYKMMISLWLCCHNKLVCPMQPASSTRAACSWSVV